MKKIMTTILILLFSASLHAEGTIKPPRTATWDASKFVYGEEDTTLMVDMKYWF